MQEKKDFSQLPVAIFGLPVLFPEKQVDQYWGKDNKDIVHYNGAFLTYCVIENQQCSITTVKGRRG